MNRLPNKGARVLLAAIEAAGGTLVKVTANGHFMIAGPAGTGTVGAHELSDYRTQRNIRTQLHSKCGLQIAL